MHSVRYMPSQAASTCDPLRAFAGVSRGLSSPVRVKAISVGEEHALALTDHGTVYSWGDGKRGQLGCGEYTAQATPMCIDSLKRKVAAVATGAYHSVFLLAAGRCDVLWPVTLLVTVLIPLSLGAACTRAEAGVSWAWECSQAMATSVCRRCGDCSVLVSPPAGFCNPSVCRLFSAAREVPVQAPDQDHRCWCGLHVRSVW